MSKKYLKNLNKFVLIIGKNSNNKEDMSNRLRIITLRGHQQIKESNLIQDNSKKT